MFYSRTSAFRPRSHPSEERQLNVPRPFKPPPTELAMSQSLTLPDELFNKLAHGAAQRGLTIEAVSLAFGLWTSSCCRADRRA